MATTAQLGYGINGISQADLDLFQRIQSGDAALKTEYQKKYGATWYIPWGQDQDRTNALYLAAESDDARLASLASDPQPNPATPGAYVYSLHDVNRWRKMGNAAFQAWLAGVTNTAAANYYAQVSGYTFSIVTPTAESPNVPKPVVTGDPGPVVLQPIEVDYGDIPAGSVPASNTPVEAIPEGWPVPSVPIATPAGSEAPMIDAAIPPNPVLPTSPVPNNNSLSLGGVVHIPPTPLAVDLASPMTPPNPADALPTLWIAIVAVIVIALVMLFRKGR